METEVVENKLELNNELVEDDDAKSENVGRQLEYETFKDNGVSDEEEEAAAPQDNSKQSDRYPTFLEEQEDDAKSNNLRDEKRQVNAEKRTSRGDTAATETLTASEVRGAGNSKEKREEKNVLPRYKEYEKYNVAEKEENNEFETSNPTQY